ncbi:MAG: LPS-assembly protein LptD, partial [Gammaproteobacteria bacterium]
MRSLRLTILLASLATLPITGMAAEGLCPALPPIPDQPTLPEGSEPGSISLEADSMDLQEEGVSTLRGRAEVVRDDQAVSASVIRYDNVANVLEAEGDIRYWDSSLFVTGEKVRVELDRRLGRLERGSYALRGEPGHGKAGLLLIDRQENQTRIEQADYTTCPGEVPDWKLVASRIDLDHESDRGSARNVTLRVRDVPVLYIPYLSFPLSDKRKTGFLFPSLGSSRESGFDIGLPFYWNIAPNYDATFIARYIENRGVMGQGEFRYLRPHMSGQLNIDYLPNDRRSNDEDRALFRFSHYQTYARGKAYLTYNHASDKQYLEDFGRGLALSSTRFLDQRLEADYNGDWWTTELLVQEYQNVDASLIGQSPYRQLPRLRFYTRLPERDRHFNFRFRGEGVYFDHQDLTRGGRVDLYPSVSYPLASEWGFLRPHLGLRHTQYFLQDQPAGNDNSPSRTLPIFSLDSGLYL